MIKNKYDFRVGDIIVEEDRSREDMPPSCYMYHILGVEEEVSSTLMNDIYLKHSYIPDDCSIDVMFINVSGGSSEIHLSEGLLHNKFLFSKKIWDYVRIRKIRGKSEYYLENNKWIKV